MVLIVAALLTVVIATLAIVRLFPASAPNSFPASFSRTVSFPLFSPEWLPTGLSIDRQSFDATAEVLTFTISDNKGKRLVFTEQPKPPQANLDTFYQQQLSGSTSFDTTAGKVTIGQFEGSTLAGIATDQTWILMRAVASINQSEFEHIVRSMSRAPFK